MLYIHTKVPIQCRFLVRYTNIFSACMHDVSWDGEGETYTKNPLSSWKTFSFLSKRGFQKDLFLREIAFSTLFTIINFVQQRWIKDHNVQKSLQLWSSFLCSVANFCSEVGKQGSSWQKIWWPFLVNKTMKIKAQKN